MAADYDAPHPADREPERRPTTWRALDLGPVIDAIADGTWQPPTPTVGRRDDGLGMFYAGKVHSIASESEAGKTWLGCHATACELNLGHGVVYTDFEDHAEDLVNRLWLMGTRREVLAKHLAYVRPLEPLGYFGLADLTETAIEAVNPTLVVIDGVAEAMTQETLDPNANADIARWLLRLPRKVADMGSAVVQLDHTAKDPERGRGRYATGGAHKLNGLDGCGYLLEAVEPFGRGRVGRSRVFVVKDRPGEIREHCAALKKRWWYGDLVVDSTQPEAALVSLPPPDDCPSPEPVPESREQVDEPEALMRKICEVLREQVDGMSQNAIALAVGGRRNAALGAIDLLVSRGNVSRDQVKNKFVHKLVRPYE
jgi:hypothetical protein